MASIESYTEAIHLNPKDSTLWNNRAMSKGKMEEFGGAISDASELFPFPISSYVCGETRDVIKSV